MRAMKMAQSRPVRKASPQAIRKNTGSTESSRMVVGKVPAKYSNTPLAAALSKMPAAAAKKPLRKM